MTFFNALGKHTDDPANPDRVPSIFTRNKATPLEKLNSTDK